jgi:hypothetical protein
MHSEPFDTSPTMAMESSDSSSLRTPSRKMGWSSAIRMRIAGLVGLAIYAA